jgi:hypothetical protein
MCLEGELEGCWELGVRVERFGLEGAVLDGDLRVDGELRTGFVWVDGRSGGLLF